MPRGGARPGAGRKPKDLTTAKLHGSRSRSVVRFPGTPSTPVVGAPVPEAVAMPRGLPPMAKTVWRELSPFALAAGTLTIGTAAAFGMFCRAVVLERVLGRGREAGCSNHRGMMQRVEAGMLRFNLAPIGKPMPKQKSGKPEDPFSEFDEATG